MAERHQPDDSLEGSPSPGLWVISEVAVRKVGPVPVLAAEPSGDDEADVPGVDLVVGTVFLGVSGKSFIDISAVSSSQVLFGNLTALFK